MRASREYEEEVSHSAFAVPALCAFVSRFACYPTIPLFPKATYHKALFSFHLPRPSSGLAFSYLGRSAKKKRERNRGGRGLGARSAHSFSCACFRAAS